MRVDTGKVDTAKLSLYLGAVGGVVITPLLVSFDGLSISQLIVASAIGSVSGSLCAYVCGPGGGVAHRVVKEVVGNLCYAVISGIFAAALFAKIFSV